MFYQLLKPLLFSLDPEDAHNLTLRIAHLSPQLGALTGISRDERFSIKIGSVQWTFPIGLAAGLDKNAEALAFFCNQGFGALECGTVTLKPQKGNPRPRMFRYPEEQNLRNAMGFPNQGLLALLPRISEYQGQCPLGLNIGKNKDTTPEESIEELTILFETLLEHANYFVINVSSPNTAGLRALQEKSYLSELFSELNKNRKGKDLYLKIAPDLSQDKIIELTELAIEYSLTGLIATNTTIVPDYGMGGMSGLILKEKSQKVRQLILNQKTNLELIAVGGISEPEDLFQLWRDGGKVAQVYTAYVYQGPKLLQTLKKEMERFVGTQKLDLYSFFELPLDERKYRLKDF